MHVSPVKTVFEIPIVFKTAKVRRATQAEEPETTEQARPDIKDGKGKRRPPPRVVALADAASQSSNGVLSALIGLQERSAF